MNRIKELVREANFSSRAFPTGTEYASWETDEVFIYNYLTGKLRDVYFSKGSKDQCCLQNIQLLVFNTLYNNDQMIASSLPKVKKKCFLVLKCTMYIVHTGFPTKDETSRTTVRNIYCLFQYINDSLQLYIYFFLCQTI